MPSETNAMRKLALMIAASSGNLSTNSLPPPLKTVCYCPAHWRTWLPQAHRTLPTRVIVSHLAHNAKPIAGAETLKRGAHCTSDLGFDDEAPRKRAKKRKLGKKRV